MKRIVLILAIVAAGSEAARSQPTSTSSNSYQPPKQFLGENLDAWIKKLNSSDPSVRADAVRVMPLFGKEAAKAVPKMVDLLIDNDISVRLTAADVLSSNPIDDPKQLKEMFGYLNENYLRNPQFTLRTQGALAIGRMGFNLAQSFPKEVAEKTIPRLLSEYQLRNTISHELRTAAAYALGRVAYSAAGSNTKAIIGLIHALNDDSISVRVEATRSLILLGAPLTPNDILTEKKIINNRVATEKDGVLRIWLRVAYMRLDQTAITDKNLLPIAKELDSSDLAVRSAAAEAIGMMGKDAKNLAGHLRAGLKLYESEKQEDLYFIIRCLYAVEQMGTEASFLKDDVKRLLNHKNNQVKAYAKQALDAIEGRKKTAGP